MEKVSFFCVCGLLIADGMHAFCIWTSAPKRLGKKQICRYGRKKCVGREQLHEKYI